MRVGIFTESYQPLINGVSTSVQTLMAELERQGHTVFVFTSQSRSPNLVEDRDGVFRFPSVNSVVERDYVLPIPFSPTIWAAIPALKLDIIHSQSPFFLGIMARRVARLLNVPLVSTNHTLYTEYAHYMPLMPPPLTRHLLVRWMHRYYNGCDRVLAPSEFTRQRLINNYGVTTPVVVVPTGIPVAADLPPEPGEIRADLGIPANGRILLSVGRLAREKNLAMLVNAFALILAAQPDMYLVMAGSGHGRHALHRLVASLGLEQRIVFTGFLGRPKLNLLYRAAEVFLFSSMTETQGLVIGEALAAGTPCVVVNAGGAPESIKDCVDGFLVGNDPAQMAGRALELLNNPELHGQMARRAREGAVEMEPGKIAQRVIATYEELIEQRAPMSYGQGSIGVPPVS